MSEKSSQSNHSERFCASSSLLRPTRLQETVRKWILLIPLSTAVAGSVAIRVVPSEQFGGMLTPMFFAGALIVTAAMLHQRHILNVNFALTDEVQVAHIRLDTLHHLSVELSTSLFVTQVAHIVLEHAMRLTNARRGALWVLSDIAAPIELQQLMPPPKDQSSKQISIIHPLAASTPELTEWRIFAAEGMQHLAGQEVMDAWKSHLQKKQFTPIREVPLDQSGVWIPIIWNGEVGAAIFMEGGDSSRSNDDGPLLEDIALIAGPTIQNALLYQRTAERAERDGLTGLYNHRAIQERLYQEISRANRARRTNPDAGLTIVVMDVNDFKLFNDTYGHAVGDQVLRAVSETLKSTFRISDIVGRFGGDEFLMLLADTSFQYSELLSARAVEAVALEPFAAPDGSRITIRLTCGVSCFPQDGENAADLLHAADNRLYEAKRKGEKVADRISHGPPSIKPAWNTTGLFGTLVSTIDSKDHYTKCQSEQVWRYALKIASQLKLPFEMMEAVHFCSLVHDVGKIVIPDAILRKPGRLTKQEFEIMQQHTIFGALLVKDLPHLEEVLLGVRHHHEQWNGSGYPDGLAGEEIPLIARILAVADSFSAMEAQRPYRKALSERQALDEIAIQKGKRYDPAVVEAFETILHDVAIEKTTFLEILCKNKIEHLCVVENNVAESDFTKV